MIVSCSLVGVILTIIRMVIEYRYFRLVEMRSQLEKIEENELEEKEKLTADLDDSNKKEYETIVKENMGENKINGLNIKRQRDMAN